MWKQYTEITREQIADFERAFRKKARFLVDEDVGRAVADVLNDRGYNSVYAPDVGLGHKDDEQLAAYAWREDRIVLTHDKRFVTDRKVPDHRNPGVVNLPDGSAGQEGLEQALSRLILILAPYRKAHRCVTIEITHDEVWNIEGFNKSMGSHFKRRIKFGKRGEVWEWEFGKGDA
jgi:predicted nuclease of predicted toxin-antitoxin system